MRNSKFKNLLTKDMLISLYQDKQISSVKIGDMFGCSSRTVIDYLNKYNIPVYPFGHFRKPIYHKNDEFFSCPNILNSFVAGFIAADGCIRERVYTKKSHELSIILSIKDLDYLKRIKELLEYSGPGPQVRNQKCHLVINSAHQYYHDLINNFGITPQKTHTMSPSTSMSWDNKLAFLIGLIDGDGCIHLNKRGCVSLSITGSKATCIWVKDIWDQILIHYGFKRLSNLYEYKKRKAFSITVCADRAKVILNVLKKINVPKMERKWSKI